MRTHLLWAAGTFVALILGIAIGDGGGETTPSAAESPTPAPAVTVTSEPELDQREDDLAAAEVAVEEGTIPGTGIFLIGGDIEPGTYRGDGSCYWARLSGTSGDFGDIIANDNPRGPTVVTIGESDTAFETGGCADWVRE